MFASIARVVLGWLISHPNTVEDVFKEIERLGHVLEDMIGAHQTGIGNIGAQIAHLEAVKTAIADETEKALAAVAELRAIQAKASTLVPADSQLGHVVATAGAALDDAALAGQVVQAVVGGEAPPAPPPVQ